MTSIILPAGTDVTKQVNLPTSGSWLGLVKVSLATFATNATIHEWLFIHPNFGDGKIRYRRTGGTLAGNYEDWTLIKDTRVSRWLFKGETMFNINYTASNDITVAVETTRGIQPYGYPSVPGTAHPTEIQATGIEENGKVYWKLPA